MRRPPIASAATAALVAVAGALTLLGPAGPARAAAEPKRVHVNVLNFDRWGELRSQEEVALAKLELERFRPERVIIVSYGWGNDGQASTATYHAWVRSYLQHIPPALRPARVAVIGIGWDSSQTAVTSLLNNVIPLPGIANAIGWLPDRLLFPFSFWAKGAQADRIGFGGVRSALNDVFAIWQGRPSHPEVFLVGHSFGTRIVSGLMKERLGPVQVGGEPFVAAEHVLGAVLLQPALPIASLDQQAAYPQLVTMSAYDHANGALFPAANTLLNTYGFTLFESLTRRHVVERVEQGIGRSVHMVGAAGDATEPGTGATAAFEQPIDIGRRTMAELAALPLGVLFSFAVMPAGYVYAQGRGILEHPVDHLMDTLAQVPGVQIAVAGLGRALGREVRWGQRSKGLFTLGPLHEAAGRMVAPTMFSAFSAPVYSIEEFRALPEIPAGPLVVDASPVIRHGLFGLDLANPLIGSTVGWLDLTGAHSDYLNEDVPRLIARLFRRLHTEAAEQPRD